MVLDTSLGIRFVMEGPHATRVRQKKRARLVTACDSCRVKKVKCHQTNSRSKCDACRTSNAPCLFGDRDRYHAERGMSLHTASSPDSPSFESSSSPAITSPSNIPWPSADSLASTAGTSLPYDFLAGNRRLLNKDSYDSLSSARSSIFSTSSSLSSPPDSPGPLDSPSILSQQALKGASGTSTASKSDVPSDTSYLFDPKRPRYPAIEYMEHLASLFFEHLSCHLPFLDRKSTLAKVKKGTLPAVLANCIAALSSRFSDRPEIIRDGPKHLAGEPFLHMAKLLVVPMMSWPSIEVLHSLVLIAWADYACARDSGLFVYSRMATAMLAELRFGEIDNIRSSKSEEERELIRATWWAVVRVDSTASWVTGRPSSISNAQVEMLLASAKESIGSQSPGAHVFSYLTELFVIRDQLTRLLDEQSSQQADTFIDAINDIQARLASFYRSLPAPLAFNHVNLEALSHNGQGSLLLMLHLMFHGVNALVNWPSIFREFDHPVPQNVEVAYASAKSIADSLLIAKSIDPSCLLVNPFFDIPLSVTAKIFLASRRSLGAGLHKSSLYNEAWNEANLATCLDVLDKMSSYWGGAAVVRLLLEHNSTSTSPFVPHSSLAPPPSPANGASSTPPPAESFERPIHAAVHSYSSANEESSKLSSSLSPSLTTQFTSEVTPMADAIFDTPPQFPAFFDTDLMSWGEVSEPSSNLIDPMYTDLSDDLFASYFNESFVSSPTEFGCTENLFEMHLDEVMDTGLLDAFLPADMVLSGLDS